MLIDMAKKKTTAVPKKKIETKTHVLKMNVMIGDNLKKKGEKISLTEEGRKFFLSKKYI